MNKQNPLKRSTSNTLLLHSVFKTIQGEGPFAGHPCVFVRLAGCNLQCPGCDTEYTEGAIEVSHFDICDKVVEVWGDGYPPLVVITGGEPFRQNIIPLIDCLQSGGSHVQIETNGSMRPRLLSLQDEQILGYCTIVCSPKTDKINPNLDPFITCFKYVMRHDDMCEDGLPRTALDNPVKDKLYRQPADNRSRDVYLQPMDMSMFYLYYPTGNPYEDARFEERYRREVREHNDLNTKACVKSCLEHGYILQLQIHKLVNVE